MGYWISIGNALEKGRIYYFSAILYIIPLDYKIKYAINKSHFTYTFS